MSITANTVIKTEFGEFSVSYHERENGFCVSFAYGDILLKKPIVRIHSACLFGEVFHSLHCDCAHQLRFTMKSIVDYGAGVIVYSYQEGRGIGLKAKIQSMDLERKFKCDTVEAFKKLGFQKSDYRTYEVEIEALKELGIRKEIILMSGNPRKISVLKDRNFKIESLISPDNSKLSAIALKEKRVKIEKMGYTY